jgi:hypothetical protein
VFVVEVDDISSGTAHEAAIEIGRELFEWRATKVTKPAAVVEQRAIGID